MKGLLFFKPLAVFALPLGMLCIQFVYFVVAFVKCYKYIFLVTCHYIKKKKKTCFIKASYENVSYLRRLQNFKSSK